MGGGTTQARRGWLEVAAVVAVLLGMIGGFGVVTAVPADAAECSTQGTFDLHRLLVEFGGTDDGTRDGTAYLDSDVDGWCYSNNDIIFTGYTPELHISCSQDLTGTTVSGPDGDAVITEFWLDSRNPANDKPDRELCQDQTTFPPPPSGPCEVPEDCLVPITLQKVDGDGTALEGASFLLDGATDYDCTSDVAGVCDFGLVEPGQYTLSETMPPNGYESLTLTDAQKNVSVTAGADPINLGTFVNTPLTCVDTEDCPVPVTLRKVDETASPLAGASFLLDGASDYTCTSDALGVCDFGQVAIGDYTLSETDAPDGYELLVLTAEQQAVSVTFGPAALELGPFVNTPTPPPPPDPQAPAIDLVKTAVVGDGATDGDLITDSETGLPTLSFSSGSPGDQTAVYEYTITNTGPVTLFDVTLVDDRLGTIIDETQGVTLAPGESTTARASETFSMEDASGGIDNIVTNTAVTTGVDSEGTEVSATDPAVIQLTAQESSILIDLEKIAVVGAGDVEDIDGAPTVTWQEAELDANEAKTIRYRFTITNIGPSTLHDIELTDEMLSATPLIPASDGLTLAPGESEVLEVDHTVTPEDVFPDDPTVVGGQIQGDLLNTASVRGSNATRDAFDEDGDDAAVFVRAPRAEVLGADALPAAGLEPEDLLPVALLLLWLGAAAIWLTDRPRPLRY